MRFSGFVLITALSLYICLGGAIVHAGQASSVIEATDSPKRDDASVSQSDHVDLQGIKTAFEARFEGLEVANVRETPVPGLYEVQVDMDLVYVDANVDYVLQGALLDAKTRVDLTAARLQKLSEVPFDSLPFQHAVKIVRGDGSRKLAVFEDPNCIYCKQLHASLKDIDNITLYSFQFPILSPDSIAKSRNIWCASDPGAALQAWMVDAKEPASARCDDNPVEEVLKLGRQLRVRGTPAILFADGSRVNGALPADQLRIKLDTLN